MQRVAIPPSSSSSSSHDHPAPAPGVCPACQGALRPLGLDEEERRQLRERLLRLAEEKQAAWQRQGKVVLTSLGGNGNGSSGSGNGASASATPAASAAGSGGAGEEREREPAEAEVVSLQALGEWLAAREPFDVRAECAACVRAWKVERGDVITTGQRLIFLSSPQFVLDAPNIAYFGQNFGEGRFSFQQIDLVLRALKAQVGKRVGGWMDTYVCMAMTCAGPIDPFSRPRLI